MRVLMIVVMVMLSLWLNTASAQMTEYRLTASDSSANDFFGVSVDLDQEFAIVGASYPMSLTDEGSAYIYRFDGESWSEEQQLIPPDGTAGDRFGGSVSIDGSLAIVGARYHNSRTGAAYVYYRDPVEGWLFQEKLTAGDGETNDQFGISVSLSGDFAVVGATGWNMGTGAAYIFKYTEPEWTELGKLTASDGQQQDNFGIVSISGDYVISGASGQDEKGLNAGAAYIFKRNGEIWAEQQKLLGGSGGSGDSFGASVSIDGDVTIVGAPAHKNELHREVGAAYIFRRDENNWTQEQILFSTDEDLGDRFGTSVAVTGDDVIVGASHDDENGMDSGSAFIFSRESTRWTHVVKLIASDGAIGDQFGSAVSIAEDIAIVGATGFFNTTGAAYVFQGFIPVILLIGDPNGDGAINVLDMLAIANDIMNIAPLDEAQLALADCNGDGNVNVLDMIAIANVIIGIFEECPGAGSKVVMTSEVMDVFESLTEYLPPQDFDRFMTLVKEVRLPETFALEQNYPNPFNPTTSIQYSVLSDQSPSHVTLKIYNISGQEVRTLVDDIQESGYYTVTWDGRNGTGTLLPSGFYFYRLEADNFVRTRRMVLLK
jgi:hypothetical protein